MIPTMEIFIHDMKNFNNIIPFFLEDNGEKIIRKLEKAKKCWKFLYINNGHPSTEYRRDMTTSELFAKLSEIRNVYRNFSDKFEKFVKNPDNGGIIIHYEMFLIFTKHFDEIQKFHNECIFREKRCLLDEKIDPSIFIEPKKKDKKIKTLEKLSVNKIIMMVIDKIPHEDIDKSIKYMENILRKPKKIIGSTFISKYVKTYGLLDVDTSSITDVELEKYIYLNECSSTSIMWMKSLSEISSYFSSILEDIIEMSHHYYHY